MGGTDGPKSPAVANIELPQHHKQGGLTRGVLGLEATVHGHAEVTPSTPPWGDVPCPGGRGALNGGFFPPRVHEVCSRERDEWHQHIGARPCLCPVVLGTTAMPWVQR